MSDLPKPAHARLFYCIKCGYVGGSSEHMAPMLRYCGYTAGETSPDLYSEQQMEEYRAASLASAQQRIEELERERDLTYRQWCGRDLMHLPLHEAVGARVAADAAQAEELERALGAEVAPRQLYEAIDADFAEDPMRRAWERLDKHTKQLWRGYANIVNAWAHTRASDRNPQGGDAPAAPGRSPESAVRRTRPDDEPAPSKAYLRGISPQSAWPFAQDDKGTK